MPNKSNRLDPNATTPLYHQIAEEIRERIASGNLSPGDVLAPLREAAETWGVHLHTVRHAYAALAREGLVETRRGPRGTRVATAVRDTPRPSEDLAVFVHSILGEARSRWGLDADALASAIQRFQPAQGRPVVYVVECSEHQCSHHAQEIADGWDVDARPWPLSRDGEPPDGEIVATYFHYNDIRRRWPLRLDRIHFVSISPDARTVRIARDAARVAVCELDIDTAEAVAADVHRVVGETSGSIAPRVIADPADVTSIDEDVVLVSPRVWARLSPDDRRAARVREIRYVFDPHELHALARRIAWPQFEREVHP